MSLHFLCEHFRVVIFKTLCFVELHATPVFVASWRWARVVQVRGPGRHNRFRISGWGLKTRAQPRVWPSGSLCAQHVRGSNKQSNKQQTNGAVLFYISIPWFAYYLPTSWSFDELPTERQYATDSPGGGWDKNIGRRHLPRHLGFQDSLQEEVTSKLRHRMKVRQVNFQVKMASAKSPE